MMNRLPTNIEINAAIPQKTCKTANNLGKVFWRNDPRKASRGDEYSCWWVDGADIVHSPVSDTS